MDPNDPRFVLSIDPRTYEWGWHSDDAAFGRVAKGVVPKRARPGVNLADARIRRRRRGSGLQESPLSSFITKARLTGRAVPLRLPRKLKPATLASALDRAFSSKVGLATLPRAALAALRFTSLEKRSKGRATGTSDSCRLSRAARQGIREDLSYPLAELERRRIGARRTTLTRMPLALPSIEADRVSRQRKAPPRCRRRHLDMGPSMFNWRRCQRPAPRQ